MAKQQTLQPLSFYLFLLLSVALNSSFASTNGSYESASYGPAAVIYELEDDNEMVIRKLFQEGDDNSSYNSLSSRLTRRLSRMLTNLTTMRSLDILYNTIESKTQSQRTMINQDEEEQIQSTMRTQDEVKQQQSELKLGYAHAHYILAEVVLLAMVGYIVYFVYKNYRYLYTIIH